MKIRLLLASVLMTFSVFGQTVPSYVPTNGLVGWWPFNGNANDESGNGNNGTVNGSTILTVNRFGNLNQAYLWDGTDSPILIPNSTSQNFQTGITFSVWLRQTGMYCQTCAETNYLSKGRNINPGGIELGLDHATQKFCFRVTGSPVSTSPPFSYFLSTATINYNNWIHLTGTYDGSSIKIYVNGILDISYSYNSTIPLNTESMLIGKQIGTGVYADNFNMVGTLDDIGVWNRALTQQEITNLYNASLPTSIPVISCPGAQIPLNINNGLVGWWPFCGDADDESGNGNNGTVNGATLTSDRFGNINSAYSFDGIGDSITVLNLPQCANYSFSGWFKADTLLTPYNVIFNQETSLENNRIQIFGTAYTPPFIGTLFTGDDGNGNLHNSTYRVDDGIWHFATIVYDHQNSIMKMYIDGILNGTSPIPVSSNFGGKTRFGNGFTQFVNPPPYDSKGFVGTLDDIGIWNRALDSSEVAQLYNTGLCTQTVAGSCDTLIFNANITGFNPVTYANQIRVYPNPARDNLVIDCGSNYTGVNGYSIKITNTLGQVLYNSLINSQLTNIQLTPPQWVNGTYVVQFLNPQGVVMDTKTIIIQ